MRSTWLTARDGTRLAIDIYLPKYLPETEEPVPVLLAAAPYRKVLRDLPAHPLFPFRETGPIAFYLDHGYAFAWLDLRGTGDSGGEWTFGGPVESADLYDTVEWLAGQEWCTGRVGMIGQSYFAMAQWNAARANPPHLACIAPYDGNTDIYRDFLYHGGIPSTGFAAGWSARITLLHQAGGHPPAGLRDGLLGEILRHPVDDDWMRDRSPFWDLDRVHVPVLSIGCWGKGPLHLRGNLLGYERLTGPKKLLVTGAADVAGAQSLFDDPEFHKRYLLPWYDHHLKGIGRLDEPPVTVWVRGADEYRTMSRWPPANIAPQALYLSGEQAGQVRSVNDGSLVWTDPGGATSWSYPRPEWRLGVVAFDEHGRPDPVAGVTTWTSPPLEHELSIAGPVVLELYLSSDQRDADVYAKVRDIAPDRAIPVTQGWLRASHRAEDPVLSTPLRPFHTHRDPQPLVPGQPYLLRVELLPAAYVFRAGHRIRLELTNGDSPLTEGPFTHDYGLKVGTDTYHHNADHPSRLLLPVLEGDTS
ncbi:CocE/NonD family hydrolase [Actinokineospora enzanensis]|uniref:CocE/NonD family hydrolase n=1 Tax=Actinokineospora enzanensis TaxID=155975 RepID=UPI0003601E94|nr:CocE/NonD family hydrolase [Actinokineospora enzanensis]